MTPTQSWQHAANQPPKRGEKLRHQGRLYELNRRALIAETKPTLFDKIKQFMGIK